MFTSLSCWNNSIGGWQRFTSRIGEFLNESACYVPAICFFSMSHRPVYLCNPIRVRQTIHLVIWFLAAYMIHSCVRHVSLLKGSLKATETPWNTRIVGIFTNFAIWLQMNITARYSISVGKQRARTQHGTCHLTQLRWPVYKHPLSSRKIGEKGNFSWG